MASQIRRRLREIDGETTRLGQEREVLAQRLKALGALKPGAAARSARGRIACPRCGRDRDFLTDADGYLAHVLEEPGDTELLEDGKPLFCPNCGEVFLWKSADGARPRKR